jgi:DNA-binding GntR family transcriptional regulator
MPVPQKIQENHLTAKERVCQTVQQWIIDGTLEPGERLNDIELAEYFSVSRTPVREALQLLSEQKLVQVVPSRGTYVTEIDMDDLRHVYQMLGGLHALAAELCIDRLDEAELEGLAALNKSFLKHASAGSAAAIEADYAFHERLCTLSANPYLIGFSEQLSLQARRNEKRFFRDYDHLLASYNGHERIISALRKRDLEAAKREIRQNWDISLEA